jgi:hypothetical protein
MSDLKLPKLPDRTPVKITLTISPDLNRGLHAYAELYRETYGATESVPELIPYILEAFLESDRNFARAQKKSTPRERPTTAAPASIGRVRRSTSPDSPSSAN